MRVNATIVLDWWQELTYQHQHHDFSQPFGLLNGFISRYITFIEKIQWYRDTNKNSLPRNITKLDLNCYIAKSCEDIWKYKWKQKIKATKTSISPIYNIYAFAELYVMFYPINCATDDNWHPTTTVPQQYACLSCVKIPYKVSHATTSALLLKFTFIRFIPCSFRHILYCMVSVVARGTGLELDRPCSLRVLPTTVCVVLGLVQNWSGAYRRCNQTGLEVLIIQYYRGVPLWRGAI